jgi:GNAT superfamily N-acetyltransferase
VEHTVVALPAPSLRIGTGADAVVVSALAIQVYLDTYGPQGVTAELAREAFVVCSADAFRERLACPELRVYLAVREDRLLGFAEVRTAPTTPPGRDAPGIEVVRLYVQPSSQRQGLGATLLLEAERLAREWNPPMVWLTAWAGNARARSFYAARGFLDVGPTPYVFEGREYENRVLVKSLSPSAV